MSAPLKVFMVPIRIWDLPTRLFHWALALSVLGLFVSAELGGSAMVWHFRFGFGVLTLLLFRLLWGLVGGHWSRWSQLSLRPKLAWSYFRGQSLQRWPGHNPLGSWSVVFLLFFLALQVSTGLFSDDEISNVGPLSFLAPGRWVIWATSWHKDWGQSVVMALLVLHLLALAWYRYKKNIALVPSMVHGNKSMPEFVTPSQDHAAQRWLALVLFLCSALAVYGLVSLGP